MTRHNDFHSLQDCVMRTQFGVEIHKISQFASLIIHIKKTLLHCLHDWNKKITAAPKFDKKIDVADQEIIIFDNKIVVIASVISQNTDHHYIMS